MMSHTKQATWSGDAIRNARKQQGLTQVGLAHRLGERVKQAHVSRWETGKARPCVETVQALSRALDIPFLDLFQRIYEPAKED